MGLHMEMRILDFLLMLIAAGLGWWAKTIWEQVKELERDHRAMVRDMGELEKNLPKEYVRKADWDRATDAVTKSIHDMRTELNERLDGIWLELKGKADKP